MPVSSTTEAEEPDLKKKTRWWSNSVASNEFVSLVRRRGRDRMCRLPLGEHLHILGVAGGRVHRLFSHWLVHKLKRQRLRGWRLRDPCLRGWRLRRRIRGRRAVDIRRSVIQKMAKIVRPGFSWVRGRRHLVGADDMYEFSRFRLPFHGMVGRRCTGVHHLGNQLHCVAHGEGLHERTEGLHIVVDTSQVRAQEASCQ